MAPGGFFGYLRTHPEEARIFDAAMSALSVTHNGSVVGAYDFSRNTGVIADIDRFPCEREFFNRIHPLLKLAHDRFWWHMF